MGLKVLGISCVTNFAAGVTDRKLDHREVLEVGERVKDSMIELLRRVLPRL
jgi:purine-nucleoside phosphorylase